jgi:hypothetical protein
VLARLPHGVLSLKDKNGALLVVSSPMNLFTFEPNIPSAFVAGLITGFGGVGYELISHQFKWNHAQRNFYFFPFALVIFIIPVVVLVTGPRNHFRQIWGWRDRKRMLLRAVLWFLGGIVAFGISFVVIRHF